MEKLSHIQFLPSSTKIRTVMSVKRTSLIILMKWKFWTKRNSPKLFNILTRKQKGFWTLESFQTKFDAVWLMIIRLAFLWSHLTPNRPKIKSNNTKLRCHSFTKKLKSLKNPSWLPKSLWELLDLEPVPLIKILLTRLISFLLLRNSNFDPVSTVIKSFFVPTVLLIEGLWFVV